MSQRLCIKNWHLLADITAFSFQQQRNDMYQHLNTYIQPTEITIPSMLNCYETLISKLLQGTKTNKYMYVQYGAVITRSTFSEIPTRDIRLLIPKREIWWFFVDVKSVWCSAVAIALLYVILWYTVEPLYNTIVFHQNTHKRHPIARP